MPTRERRRDAPGADPLARRVLEESADRVAPRLIGCRLVRELEGVRLVGVIVETEAYLGERDRAAHAFGGRRTPRNESMYGPAGTAYVYFTYGMHHCFNVVCAGVGIPQAVLVRAVVPAEGLEAMRARRFRGAADRALCSGPGKLCQAMAIDRALDGADLCVRGPVYLMPPAPGWTRGRVVRDRRIGLGDVGAWGTRRLRWLVAASEFVSVGVRRRPGEIAKRKGPARRRRARDAGGDGGSDA